MEIYEKYLKEAKTKNIFILDNLKKEDIIDAKTGDVYMTLPRFAVWKDGNVVQSGDDLNKLLKKYKLTKKDVYKIKGK